MRRGAWPTSIFAWAHPHPSIDLLLQAAAHTDSLRAATAWKSWTAQHPLDDALFSEQRLLAALASRLDVLDASDADRGRIVGIERMMWSRTQWLLRDVSAALELLQQHQVQPLIFKGAARMAQSSASIRTRAVNDVDVLVREEQFRTAFELLADDGWRCTHGGSALYHRTLLGHVHGVNLIRGQIADLDLHRAAFHRPHDSPDEDNRLWDRSLPGTIGSCAVRIPSATDMLVMALGHGGLDGHASSDWMLDVVHAIDSGNVDWELFRALVERRRLAVAAAVVLSYVAEKLARPVPAWIMTWVARRARRNPLRLLQGILLARPKRSCRGPLALARGVAKLFRLQPWQQKVAAAEMGAVTCRAKVVKRTSHAVHSPSILHTDIIPSDRCPDGTWPGLVEATLSVDVPATRRRIEFELNSDQRHLARLTHRKLAARRGTLTLRFRVPVTLQADERKLILQAVPGRTLRPRAPRQQTDRYGELPFQIVTLDCRPRSV